jgi:AraC family transcriptional regulator of adaptative response / DNA-3-methyladenine glycosylase II
MKLTDQHKTEPLELDPERCRAARLSRDSRFDGEFFLAVKTTGIYCRPVCPARPPAEKNVSYFRHAAQAAKSGYRPCLRCRPESAPNSPAWRGTSTTVQRALDLIGAGALNGESVEELASRLGVGERYLRKLFEREVGASPVAVAQNQRLLFAKKLLAETALSVTDIAYAAGYSSVRRFNSAIRSSFNTTPSGMRKIQGRDSTDYAITLQLQYRPPYDWDGVMDFFSRHAIDGVERVDGSSYQRNLLLNEEAGHMRVSHLPQRNALQLQLTESDPSQLLKIVARVRRMFDLDANPQFIHEALSRDVVFKSLLHRFPGIRAPAHGSIFESTVRAIVGQQVSIQAARKVISRLAATTSQNKNLAPDGLFFPAPEDLFLLGDKHFPMPTRRRDTLKTVSKYTYDHDREIDLEILAQFKGIGPWTTGIVAMRGYSDPDIFPTGDLGLVKAYAAIAGDIKLDKNLTLAWRPWRSYAANLLWRSLSA